MKTLPKNLSEIRNGGLYRQKIRCGKPNCHCASGASFHSAYYLFTRVDGKLIKRYVRKADLPARRLEIARSRDLRRRRWRTTRDSILHWRELRDTVRSHELATNTRKENPTDAKEAYKD